MEKVVSRSLAIQLLVEMIETTSEYMYLDCKATYRTKFAESQSVGGCFTSVGQSDDIGSIQSCRDIPRRVLIHAIKL